MISFAELLPRLVTVTKLTERDHEFECPRCGGRAGVRSFGRGWSAKCPRCGNLGEDDFTPVAQRQSGSLTSKSMTQRDEGSIPSRRSTLLTSSAAQPAHEEVSEHRPEESLRRDNAAPAAGSLNGAGGGRYKPDVHTWKLAIYTRARDQVEDLLHKGTADSQAAAEMVVQSAQLEDWIATVNQQRNVPLDNLTNDPALNAVEIDEEIQVLARALLERYTPRLPAVQNGNGAVKLLELPDLSRKEIEPLRWTQMRQRRAAQQREWIVEGLLARGEMSSWAGKVEAGKTTLMRELTLCIVRGEPFLGRETQRGKVAYLMLDADGEEETYDEFDKLGFTDEDGENTLFIFEPMLAQIDHGLEKLVKMLLDFGPTLAVIDPYPRLKKIEDFSGYENTYLMGELSHVARLVRAHFALPGHIPRGRDDDADVATAGFGSISFSGGVNARFIVTNRKGTHTIRSSKGKGSSFKAFDAEYVTQQDELTNRIELGAPWSWKDKARSYMEVVQQFLDSHEDRPFDVVTLAKEIRAQKSVLRTAANMLFGKQAIRREGEGLKSAPFIYASLAYHGKLTMEEVKRD